jgi:hypothetical protein
MTRVWPCYAGPTVLVAGIVLIAIRSTAATAQDGDCPDFTAPSPASEEFVAFGAAFDPIGMDFGTNRGSETGETILTAQPPQGQKLPQGNVEVEVNALRRGTHGSLKGVNAAAVTQGRNRVKVTVCVDPRRSDVGTYSGFVVVTDPRFDTLSVPVTVRLQHSWTGWTVFVPALLAVVAVALAAASIEARGPSDEFLARYRKRVWGIQSLLAFLPAVGAAYAAWVAQVYNNPSWGADGIVSWGAFWLVAASAVTAATAVLTTSAAAGT